MFSIFFSFKKFNYLLAELCLWCHIGFTLIASTVVLQGFLLPWLLLSQSLGGPKLIEGEEVGYSKFKQAVQAILPGNRKKNIM